MDLKNKFIPVMKANFYDGFASVEDCMTNTINNVRVGFNSLLPFAPAEAAFMDSVVKGTGIKPELFIADDRLINLIKRHPALLWAEKKTKRVIE